VLNPRLFADLFGFLLRDVRNHKKPQGQRTKLDDDLVPDVPDANSGLYYKWMPAFAMELENGNRVVCPIATDEQPWRLTKVIYIIKGVYVYHQGVDVYISIWCLFIYIYIYIAGSSDH